MSSSPAFSHSDLRILLRIIGSRKGANVDEIVAFHESHHWSEGTMEHISEVVGRLSALGWVSQQDGKFFASQKLQSAFNEACRNCQDTLEEYEILSHILQPEVSFRGSRTSANTEIEPQ